MTIDSKLSEYWDVFIELSVRVGPVMDLSPTSPPPDVDDSVQMVLGSQSFRDEVQTMIAQQMKVDSLPVANAFHPYAARGYTANNDFLSPRDLRVSTDVRSLICISRSHADLIAVCLSVCWDLLQCWGSECQ